ncbi:hypothetical protein PCAR4_370021 [Paraburkholderia caribensis]|nr:hypothetical protein PCAR4_370021 [Paraburkholderia caribensis]
MYGQNRQKAAKERRKSVEKAASGGPRGKANARASKAAQGLQNQHAPCKSAHCRELR